MDKPASHETENKASRETEIASPCRGLPQEVSREAELLAEALRKRPRVRQSSLPRPSVRGLARGGDPGGLGRGWL
jgi:hypothetical protein